MKTFSGKSQKSILIGLIASLIFLFLVFPSSVFAADNETYGWQGIGNTETGDINQLIMIDPEPSNITVIHTAKDKNDTYINQINTPIKAADGFKIVFTMKAGMGSFNGDNFKNNCMPYIALWDENEENIVASAENGVLKFYENESHGKGEESADDLGKIVIGAEEDALEEGDYVLVFGPEICGNNTSKNLGVPIKFKFSLEVVPELNELVQSIQEFLNNVELYDEQNLSDEELVWGKYPENKAELLKDAVEVAQKEQDPKVAAKVLNNKFKEFKESVAVGILSVKIKDFTEEIQVGDTGIAEAEVASTPEDKKYQKVTWNVISGNGCIDIDEKTGEWTANYPGEAVVRATTTKGTFGQKYQDKKIKVAKPKDHSISVNISKSGTLQATVKKANENLADITALKISTSNGAVLSDSDLMYIKSLDELEKLDVFYADCENWKLDGIKTLKTAILSKTMKSLDAGTFKDCINLENIEIPASVSRIDNQAFVGCSSLPECITIRSVSPPQYEGMKGDTVFVGTNVTSIKVPFGCVTTYREADQWKAFGIKESEERKLIVKDVNTKSLKTKAEEQLKQLQLDESEIDTLIIATGKYQWLDRTNDISWIQNNCLNATTIDLSSTNLEDSKVKANYFKNRVNLKKIKLPSTIVNLGGSAFAGCVNLQDIELPSSLESIGNNVFQDCSALPEIMICNAKFPPVYSGALPPQIKGFRVPTSSIGAYKQQVGWSQYLILGQIEASLDKTAITLKTLESAEIKANVKTYGSYSNNVYWKSSDNNIVTVTGDKEKATVKGLKTGNAEITLCDTSGSVLGKCAVTVKRMNAPGNVKVTSVAYNKLKVSWSAVTKAEKYIVYRCNSKGTVIKSWTLNTSARTFTDNGLTTGTTYYYKVRAYRSLNGVNYYGEYSSIKSGKPSLSKVSSVKVAKGGTQKVKISWKKISGASGYVVYQSTKKSSGFKAVKTVKGNSTVKYTTAKLKKGKTYYFKVKAYRTVSKKKVYSPSYSSVVKYKVK